MRILNVRTFDARAWVVWLFVGGLLAILIGNPLYLILLLLISLVVRYACSPAETSGLQLPFWRVSLMILVFSTFFNMLTAHVGQTVLGELPAGWPLIGGPITLEAAAYGFLSGLRLVTLLSFFLAFNSIVPVAQLTGLAPAALHEMGLVMLIAITYVPETARQFRRIRDAQAIRGHRLRGFRDWRPILIPLLIAGLERALNLAETMVSRGYGHASAAAVPLRPQLLLLIGLLLAFVGALRLAWAASLGLPLIMAGIIAVALAYRHLSHGYVRTLYRPRRWAWADTILVAGALIPLLLLLPLPGVGRSALAYAPYPQFFPPPFDPVAGLAILGLSIPAALALAPDPTAEGLHREVRS
jgi:energy-coupling factor transport system permease protein